MSAPAPVIMLGLDAAEHELVRRLAAEGGLPTLRRLMDTGTAGRLTGNAARFAGGVWPTFYTARDVPAHGLYHNKLWRQERMRCEIADASWFPEPPFWERLSATGLRLAVLDVPMTVATPKPVNGLSIAGWGTHDVISRGSWPPRLWSDLAREHGPPRMPPELFGPQTPGTLERLEHELITATEQMARIGASVLARERWDLFLLVFGAAHRGGHYLWDASQVDTNQLGADRRGRLETSLQRVYQSADRALATVLASAPADARVLVFAVHGMGPNTTWADRCADILARIQAGGPSRPPRQGFLYRVKRRLPWGMVREVTRRLPATAQARLVSLWSRSMFDWRTTGAFPLPMDHAGYIRINLRGREPAGIVEPGAAYAALCDELADGLESFRDIASGRPIVRRVHRLAELPGDPPARHRLPDLVVEWADVSPIGSPGIVSPRYGEMRWSPAGRLPSGRAGNHRAHGWFVAAGPGIPAGATAEERDIRDLVPTVWRWLGAGALPAGF